MRIIALASAAAFVSLAAPAMAQSGYVDLSYSNTDLDVGGGPEPSIDGYRLGGETAFASGGLGVQLGGNVSSLDLDGVDATIWGVDGHLFSRSGAWLWGGTLGYRDADVDLGGDSSSWLGALQAHYEAENVTWVGAVSYSPFEAGADEGHTIGVDGQVRLFASENLRFDGTLGWRDIDFDGGGDSSDWHGGVGGEWQLAAWPVSVFGGYTHTDNEDADLSSDALTFGVRLNWGGTLFDRDRDGATMLLPGDGLSPSGL